MLDLSGLLSGSSPSLLPSWIELLPPDHAGTLRTLQLMRWFCRRDSTASFVETNTKRLLESRPASSPVETLFLFARDRIRFREDAGPNGEEDMERIADFQRTTELGWGDCDDKCVWLGTGLLSQGISCRFRVQSYFGTTWDHVYLEFWSWERWTWQALDPTADGHTGIVAEIGWRQKLPITGREMIYPI